MRKISAFFLCLTVVICSLFAAGLAAVPLNDQQPTDTVEEVIAKEPKAETSVQLEVPKKPKKVTVKCAETFVNPDIRVDLQPKERETKSEAWKRREAILQRLEKMASVHEMRPQGPHMKAGDAAVWVINNFNSREGKSLTGPAIIRLTKNYHPYRIKIGIFNAEFEMDRGVHCPILDSLHDFEPWEKELEPVMFGVHIMTEF